MTEMKRLKKDDKQKNVRRAFGNSFGMKFDGHTHSAILTDGVVNLSYSYLTFLMQTVEDMEDEDFVFDVEEYNYLINKRTALHDGELIKDYTTLSYIIKELESYDVQLLE
jgi:hypothetical protein